MATTFPWKCCAGAGRSRSRSCSRVDARRQHTGEHMRGRRWFMAMGLVVALAAAASRAENEAPPAAAPAAPPAAAAKEAAPPPSVTVIAPKEAHGVLGRDVRSPTDEDMGRIVDILVDRTGTVRAAVIDFGGFLGVGSRKIVVDWNALHFGRVNNKGDSITLEL